MIHGKFSDRFIIISLKASRDECKAHFHTRDQAEKVYILAFAMDSLHILPRHGEFVAGACLAVGRPTPEALMQAFSMASNDFLGAEGMSCLKASALGYILRG